MDFSPFQQVKLIFVKHEKYGIGYVIKINYEKLEIVFENHGKKTIISDYVEVMND